MSLFQALEFSSILIPTTESVVFPFLWELGSSLWLRKKNHALATAILTSSEVTFFRLRTILYFLNSYNIDIEKCANSQVGRKIKLWTTFMLSLLTLTRSQLHYFHSQSPRFPTSLLRFLLLAHMILIFCSHSAGHWQGVYTGTNFTLIYFTQSTVVIKCANPVGKR